MPEEHELEALAKQLGDREAEGIDAERVATAVLARLKTEPAVAHWWRRPVLRQVAAAAVLVLAVGLFVARPGTRQPPSPGEVPLVVSLDELAPPELAEIIDSLAVDAPVSEFVPASLEDLSARQLELLLENLEG
jgi:hypothetical protein